MKVTLVGMDVSWCADFHYVAEFSLKQVRTHLPKDIFDDLSDLVASIM